MRFSRTRASLLPALTTSDEGYRFELRDVRFAPDDSSPDNIVVRVDFNGNLQIRLEELRYASSKAP